MGIASRVACALVGSAALTGAVLGAAPPALDSYATAVAPLDPNKVFVFSQRNAGHWVTTSADGGATWGPPVENTTVFGFPRQTVVLGNGAVLLAVGENGGYRSVDGGATWKRTLRTRNAVAWAAADAARPAHAWAMTDDGLLLGTVNSAVTWRRSAPRAFGCTSVASQPGTRVVLASCVLWIWRSVNAGATWKALGPIRYPLTRFSRPSVEFESVAFDPTRRGVVIAAADGWTNRRPQIWRSVNAGRTWKRIPTPAVSRRRPPSAQPLRGTIRVTAGGGRIIAGPYWSGATRVILVSADGGATWTVEPLDTSLPTLQPGLTAIPEPANASGSPSALFMPVLRGAGQVLTFRPGATGWAAMTFFTPPPPPPPPPAEPL